MPSGDGPATVVRIFDAELITAAHETLDVIGAEAKVTVTHGVYVFFHLEPGFQVSLRPMELNVTIREEVHFSGVGTVFPDTTHNCVLLVGDRTQFKKRFVELGQTRQIVGTDVHVMELEIHRHFLWLGLKKNPTNPSAGFTLLFQQETARISMT